MQTRQTLAVLVDNEAGVLSQVTRLFSRKGYNIESLAVGVTEDPKTSRITIEILADEDHTILLANQLRKLIPVHSVKILNADNAVRRELVLYKVKTENATQRGEIINLVSIFRATILNVSIDSLTIAIIGEESKIEGLGRVLEEFTILELVRTGVVALERGRETIYDETKEKGEFNYGKNVL